MSSPTQAIAVTGAAGYVGARLVERLLRDEQVRCVVGVDVRAARVAHERYVHLRQDVRAPLADALRSHGVEAVAHLAFVLRQTRRREEGRAANVGGTERVLAACADAGVRRVVLMSSATAYGARPGATGMSEEAPLRPARGFAYAEDKAACEALLRRFAAERRDVAATSLRGCVVMGPGAANFITAALARPMLIGVRGADPPMQFVHEDDMAEILARCVTEPHPGAYNVAAPGAVRWSEVVAAAGKPLLRLPAPAAYGLAQLAWLARLQSDAPAAGVDYVRWPWTVSTARLEAELSHTFAYDARGALASWAEGRLRAGPA